jgi:hypothetical protein
MSTRVLVAATLLLIVTNSLAQVPPSLVGTWVTVHDPNGVVFPHLEELRIAGDGSVVTAVYGTRSLPKCEYIRSALSGPCAGGRTNAKGKLVVDDVGQTIALASMALERNAMAGIGLPQDELVSRESFWFGPGKPWQFRRRDEALGMLRQSQPVVPNTVLDGTKAIRVEKWYFRVDDDFAGNAIALAQAGSFSVAALLCIIPYATNSAGGNSAFRSLVRDIAIVERRQQEMSADALANRNADAIAKTRTTLAILQRRSSPPSAAQIAAAAAVLRVDASQVSQYVREISLRADSTEVEQLLFSALKPHEAQIRACHKRHFT